MFLITIIATFLFMEFMAWFAHKYVMHGFLWNLHEDHHYIKNNKGFFQKNDYFFLIFATPAMLSFISGAIFSLSLLSAIGIGITIYGFCYFMVHDVYIHRRFNLLKKLDNFYFRALRQAHKTHHIHPRENSECFGMLIVPFHFYKEELAKRK